MDPLTKAYLETTTATFLLSLPPEGTVLVKKGALISTGQIVAKGEKTTLKKLNLAKALGVPGKKVINLLVKSLGSEVIKGELIARRGGILKKRKFLSPIKGTLESLSEEGILKIKVAQDKYEVRTPLAGQIVTVGRDKMTVSFPAKKIVGIWGAGGQVFGQLVILGSQDKGVNVFDLKGNFQGKIVAFSGPLTHGFWYKAATCEVAGIVCGKLPNEQFSKKIEKEFLQMAGHKDSIIPPILVVGSGKDGLIKEEIWRTMKDSQEKTVVIDGKQKCLLIPR